MDLYTYVAPSKSMFLASMAIDEDNQRLVIPIMGSTGQYNSFSAGFLIFNISGTFFKNIIFTILSAFMLIIVFNRRNEIHCS